MKYEYIKIGGLLIVNNNGRLEVHDNPDQSLEICQLENDKETIEQSHYDLSRKLSEYRGTRDFFRFFAVIFFIFLAFIVHDYVKLNFIGLLEAFIAGGATIAGVIVSSMMSKKVKTTIEKLKQLDIHIASIEKELGEKEKTHDNAKAMPEIKKFEVGADVKLAELTSDLIDLYDNNKNIILQHFRCGDLGDYLENLGFPGCEICMEYLIQGDAQSEMQNTRCGGRVRKIGSREINPNGESIQ